MTRTAPAGRTLRFITALSAKLTCPKPNARPIRHNGQVPDRNGKIFYTSITSLSHISKEPGRQAAGRGRRRCPDRRDPCPAAVRAAGLSPASLPTIFRTTNT
nr:hypothetical protein [Faecalibacterium prausnitzii]